MKNKKENIAKPLSLSPVDSAYACWGRGLSKLSTKSVSDKKEYIIKEAYIV